MNKSDKALLFFIGLLFGFIIASGLTCIIYGANSDATVSWSANIESDLAGYKIYYGTSSGNYDDVIDVGNNTSYQITNLDSSTIYYFAVTALDFSSNESSFSEEVSWKTDNIPIEEEEETEEHIETIAYNYKNPFNADTGTEIVFITEKSGNFSIDIYTVDGKLVKNLIGDQEIIKGTYKFKWDSTDNNGIKINPGVYLGKLILNAKITVIKMVIKS